MPLELEPLPPEPPAQVSERLAPLRREARAARRRRFAELSRLRLPTMRRSTTISVVVHASLLFVVWLLMPFRPHEAEKEPPAFRIHIKEFVEASDPEAQAGGGKALVAQAPQGGEKGAAGSVRGLLFDDENDATSIGLAGAPGGSLYLGRVGGHERLLEAGGGDGATEGALRLAFEWLSRHQASDGTWNARTFGERCRGPACGGRGEEPYVDATTALALLPYLGAGHTQRSGPWQDTVKRGLRALVAQQKADGSFGGDRRRGYASTISALTLAEAYGLTQSPALREPAQRAADFLVRTQSRSGGWRYDPGDGATDSSVTGWGAIALVSAAKAGLDVPEDARLACRGWFASVRNANGDFGYTARGGGSAALLGVGAFAQILLGDDPAARHLAATFDQLERRTPRAPRDEHDSASEFGVADPIHWYYGGLAAFQRGGDTWTLWNAKLREALLPTQVRDDAESRGSWPPLGATGRAGGRVVTTALCALSLEVYYRYPRATMR